MATITTLTYNGVATALAITSAATLASSLNVGAGSIAADNTSNKYVDAQAALKVTWGATTPGGFVLVGVGTSMDQTNYGAPYGGTDTGVTFLRVPVYPTNFTAGPNGTLYIPGTQVFFGAFYDAAQLAASSTVYIQIPSIANAVGSPNVLPGKWGVTVLNSSLQAFTACTLTYTGITYTNT